MPRLLGVMGGLTARRIDPLTQPYRTTCHSRSSLARIFVGVVGD